MRGRDPPGPGKGHRDTQTLGEFGNFQWLNAGMSPLGQPLAAWAPLPPPPGHPCPRPAWPYLSLFPLPSAPQVLTGFTGDLSCFPSLGPTLPLQSPPQSLTHRASCIIDLPVEPGWPERVPRAPVATAAGTCADLRMFLASSSPPPTSSSSPSAQSPALWVGGTSQEPQGLG